MTPDRWRAAAVELVGWIRVNGANEPERIRSKAALIEQIATALATAYAAGLEIRAEWPVSASNREIVQAEDTGDGAGDRGAATERPGSREPSQAGPANQPGNDVKSRGPYPTPDHNDTRATAARGAEEGR